jgi:hypothetical protein
MYFKFYEYKPNSKLGEGLFVWLMTFSECSDSWNTQQLFEYLLGNDSHIVPNHSL